MHARGVGRDVRRGSDEGGNMHKLPLARAVHESHGDRAQGKPSLTPSPKNALAARRRGRWGAAAIRVQLVALWVVLF